MVLFEVAVAHASEDFMSFLTSLVIVLLLFYTVNNNHTQGNVTIFLRSFENNYNGKLKRLKVQAKLHQRSVPWNKIATFSILIFFWDTYLIVIAYLCSKFGKHTNWTKV